MYEGQIRKMSSSLGEPIEYFLPIGDEKVAINKFIGSALCLSYEGKITCIRCGRKTKKSFSQGFCFPCMRKAPEASECIIKPELCQAHEGIGRDPEWEKENHLSYHCVYLAVSSSFKVGVTRYDQIPTRWIDQGATWAIRLAKTPYRQLAGLIEVELKEHFSDKTNWRRMLKNEILDPVDLPEMKVKAISFLSEEFIQYCNEEDNVFHMQYPVLEYPTKVKSVGFDKYPKIEGVLKGIKGQYLLFDGERVLNIRKHGGYHILLEQ